MATSESLLPTPEARNNVGYQVAHGKRYLRLGAVVSTSLREDSPASRSARRGSERVPMMTATCGQKCLELYELSRRHGSSLRTCVGYLLSAAAWCSSRCALTWKEQVTKSSRLLFQLVPSTPRTAGTGYGLLPTAKAQNAMASGPSRVGNKVDLQTKIAMLPTPQVFDATASHINGKEYSGTNSHAEKLEQAINRRSMLPTTNAGHDYRDTKMKPSAAEGKHGKSIAGVLSLLPTPRASKHTHQSRSDFTPNLAYRIGESGGNGLRLQPAFVEWMMNYPLGWTDVPVPARTAPRG